METDNEHRKIILAKVEEAGLLIEALRWRGQDGVKVASDFGIPLLAPGAACRSLRPRYTYDSGVPGESSSGLCGHYVGSEPPVASE